MEKSYILIFVCSGTLVVHLQLIEESTVKTLLPALQKFI